MSRWKLFLILVLAVVLLHILIIKIFIVGSSDSGEYDSSVSEKIVPVPEPVTPVKW